MRYLYFAVAFYVVVYSLSLAGALLLRLHDAFRSRRRGGAPRPVALRLVSPQVTYTTGLTPRSAGFSSSPTALGNQSEAQAIRQRVAAQSSSTAPGCFGSAAGVGDSPGQQHGLAG